MGAPKPGSAAARFVSTVHSNIQSPLIEITEDKLKNILTKFIDRVKDSVAWTTPLSLFLSMLITVLTADFNKDVFGIKKETWAAMFYLVMVGAFLYGLYRGIRALISLKKCTIESVIEVIKDPNQT